MVIIIKNFNEVFEVDLGIYLKYSKEASSFCTSIQHYVSLMFGRLEIQISPVLKPLFR